MKFTPLQFVVSGQQFNMTFLLLSMQSIVCVTCVLTVKKLGIISFRDFDTKDAATWFPISVLLVSVIYTGSKSLVCFRRFMLPDYFADKATLKQYLSIPVYTIFKNLTIILIVCFYPCVRTRYLTRIQAYGEVLWFNGRITGLTMVAFLLMVCPLPLDRYYVVFTPSRLGPFICPCRMGRCE